MAAERALLAGLGGSCRTPLGGQAVITGDRMRVTGLVGRPDGSEILREEVEGSATDAIALGSELAAAPARPRRRQDPGRTRLSLLSK